MGKGDTIAPDPHRSRRTYKRRNPQGISSHDHPRSGHITCLATSFKEVVRLQGHKTTAISKQLGEYFDLAHPYRGRAGQAEYLGGTPDSAPQRKRTTRKRKTNPCGHSQFKIHIKIPGFRRHPKEPQVRALFRPRPFPHSENGRAGQSSVLGMPPTASRRTAYPEKKEHPCGHPRITIPGILSHPKETPG